MTKKLTIGAAAAAAALTLAAVSASAHAAPPADVNVAPGDIVFSAVDETFIVLENTTPDFYSLDGHHLVGCVGANDNDPTLVITFGENDFIDGFDDFVIAHPSATVGADARWNPGFELDSSDYDLRLVDFGVFPAEVVAHTTNGNPDQDCVDSLPPLTP